MATWSRSYAWSAAARFRLARLLPDRRLGLRALVPRLGALGHLHGALVALAGQQHRVARTGDLDRASDCGAAVDHDLVIPAWRLADHPGLHVPRDLGRVLPVRVVGGDDEKVGPVVVGSCGRAEDRNQTAARVRPQLR